MRLVSFGISLVGAVGAGALGLSWLRTAPVGLPSVAIAGYLLVAALVLGCIAGMLILQRRDRIAAPLLLGVGLLPGIVEPKAFVATFLLVLAAFLTTGRAGPVRG
jgi:hypothetical protein